MGLREMLQDSDYQQLYVKHLIWIRHQFEFPLRQIETLKLPEPTIIELMEMFNTERKRYRLKAIQKDKRKHR